jgi:predicted nucleic acid-binding protein
VTWLLDTDVLSGIRKGPRCHPRVAAWFATVDDSDLWVSAIGLGEIRKGIESIRRRDADRAVVFEAWLARLLRDHAERVLPVDVPVAEEWGAVDRTPIGVGDRYAARGDGSCARIDPGDAERPGRGLDRGRLPGPLRLSAGP